MRAHEIFFTSDTHFFHPRMVNQRGFPSFEEMHEVIIRNWNNVVSTSDEVYLLGDFSFGNVSDSIAILEQLNGHIHFIKGNHDKTADKIKHLFESYADYKHLKVYDNETKMQQRIMLSHYSFQVWDASHHGSWNLYGHSHGTLAERQGYKSCDVGMDCWSLCPVSYTQIKEKFSDEFYQYCSPIDKHGQKAIIEVI